ncbi:transcription factor GTE1-like [Malus domestica]|uniref:transcription factor GTE1-like n=1 Tax=Malus domestica TaxID=3750 RepID=UPI0039747BC4
MEMWSVKVMRVSSPLKRTSSEKRKLWVTLARLSPEDLSKALEIVAQSNPGFQATADKVDLDIDAQTQSTLWRLKVFVKDAIQVQGKSPASMVSNTNTNNNSGNNKTNHNISNAITRRKREISDAIVKTTKKKSKKPSPS